MVVSTGRDGVADEVGPPRGPDQRLEVQTRDEHPGERVAVRVDVSM
jgi:hypothetical protein